MSGTTRNVTGNISIPGTQLVSTANSKIAKDYIFQPSTGVVTIKDDDFLRLLFGINVTDGMVIFNPLDKNKDGAQTGNSINLEFNTTSMSSNDDLMLIYEAQESDEIRALLEEISDSLKITNKLLLQQLEF